jgi:hypothetical protein
MKCQNPRQKWAECSICKKRKHISFLIVCVGGMVCKDCFNNLSVKKEYLPR